MDGEEWAPSRSRGHSADERRRAGQRIGEEVKDTDRALGQMCDGEAEEEAWALVLCMVWLGPLVLSSVDSRDGGKASVLRAVAAVTCRLSRLSARNYQHDRLCSADVRSDPFSQGLV
jgi:hypothetical protein